MYRQLNARYFEVRMKYWDEDGHAGTYYVYLRAYDAAEARTIAYEERYQDEKDAGDYVDGVIEITEEEYVDVTGDKDCSYWRDGM